MITLIMVFIIIGISSYWYYIDSNHIRLIDKDYDKLLNELMDDDVDIVVNRYTMKFNSSDFTIWIGNYPYAYGYIYNLEVYPTMKTRKRLKKYILKKMVKSAIRN